MNSARLLVASEDRHYRYLRIYMLLRREGVIVNHKRVYRLYAAQGLSLRSKMPHRRRAMVARSHRIVPVRPNQVWAMDFMRDRPTDHRKSVCLPWNRQGIQATGNTQSAFLDDS